MNCRNYAVYYKTIETAVYYKTLEEVLRALVPEKNDRKLKD